MVIIPQFHAFFLFIRKQGSGCPNIFIYIYFFFEKEKKENEIIKGQAALFLHYITSEGSDFTSDLEKTGTTYKIVKKPLRKQQNDTFSAIFN